MSALVSICLPVLNGAEYIGRALDSALAQTYEPIEIVVSDDCSADGTADLVRERYGDAVRLHLNAERAGLSGNHNAAVRHAGGELIKFLHHDDTLEPDCVAKMVAALAEHPSAGFVFARRRLIADDQSEEARRSNEVFYAGLARFGPLNDGRTVLRDWLAGDFPLNCIGEPVSVMVRREALERTGLFSPHLRQLMDIDLWMRILAAGFDAAFIDEELATYRQASESSTGRTVTRRLHWLDPLWMLEHLRRAAGAEGTYPRLGELVAKHRRMAFRSAARSLVPAGERYPLRPYGSYVQYRLRPGSDDIPRLA
jgi:glycosyltransferase involved in cell wall biosynthesis